MTSQTAAGTWTPGTGPHQGAAVLVAQFFPPQNAVAAQRALRFARALLDRYDRLYVVCLDASELDPSFLDHEFGRDVLQNARLVRLVSPPLLNRYGYGSRGGSLVHSVLGGVTTRLFCGFGADWIPAVRRSLDRIPPAEDVRVAIATGPPFIPFGTAAAWAARRSVPLVLDYRDLWTANPHAQWPWIARALVNRLFERRVNRRAAALSTVSEGCKAMLEQDAAAASVHVLYNAPDQAYLAYFRTVADDVAASRREAPPAAGSSLRIVFAGQVYQGCTFAPLLRALVTLPAGLARRIELHYYGASSELARREFVEFGLSSCLVDHGKVSKDASVRAICGADLLLSLIHTDHIARNPAVAGHMSTKVYDYFLSGRPILNIGPVNAETGSFAAQLGYRPFHSFPADDTAGLAGFLERAAADGPLEEAEPLSVTLPQFEAGLHALIEHAADRPVGRRDAWHGAEPEAPADGGYATRWRQATPVPSGFVGRSRGLLRNTVLSLSSAVQRSSPDAFLRCLYCHYVFDDQRGRFDSLVAQLKSTGEFVDTDTCVRMLAGQTPIDRRYYHLSFDDGFRNNFTNAFPILRRHGVPAIFFVPSAMMVAGWEEARAYCLERTRLNAVLEMLRWEDLEAMCAAGYEVGSHTRTHARFSTISHDAALLEDEILGSKEEIASHLGRECRYISWPYGRLADADEQSLGMTRRAGYRACFGAFRGTVVPGRTDAFRIPRHLFEVHWPVSHVTYFAAGNMEASP